MRMANVDIKKTTFLELMDITHGWFGWNEETVRGEGDYLETMNIHPWQLKDKIPKLCNKSLLSTKHKDIGLLDLFL